MELLIGTGAGLFVAGGAGRPAQAHDLAARSVRYVGRIGDALFAGAEDGVFRSRDGGRAWKRTGVPGRMVWDMAATPGEPGTLHAGTQPAGLFRSRDGGESWAEVDQLLKIPGAERWCVPGNPPSGARARTVVFDPASAQRCWVGIEVGGVASSADGGATWALSLPGNNPDIHVMAAHPGRANVLFATTGFGRIDNSEPMEQRIAGLFRSEDGGASWRYLWADMQPKYTRPMCIDPRAPHALTVACAPSAFSSHRDPGGAQAMLYRSDDSGESWRSLGDADHAPSAANFLAVAPDPEEAGAVLVGTDTGEVWRVTSDARWSLLADGLPMVQAVCALG